MLVYLSGPMSGCPNNNVDAFDHAQAVLELDHVVISPVDVERRAGRDMSVEATDDEYERFVDRDLDVVRHLPVFAHALKTMSGVVLLPGWEKSGGCGREGRAALEARVPLYEYAPMRPNGVRWLPTVIFSEQHTTTRATHG